MKHPRHLSDASLAFHIADAHTAIAANPGNPKVPQYFAEAEACQHALVSRRHRRLERQALRLGIDPLALPLTHRHYSGSIRPVISAYDEDRRRDARCILAFSRS